MPNNIAISITADVADLTAKRAIMSAELRAATKDLNEFAKTARTGGMTDELRSGMLQAATAAAQARAEITALDAEMKMGSGSAESRAMTIRAFAQSVLEAKESLIGFGELMVTAFAVRELAEFVNKMGEAAEKTLHTAETFGLTVGEVQRMNAQAALFGVPAEAMTTAMQRLDKSFSTAKQGGAQQANAFRQVGIDLKGAYTQTQLLNAALEGLGKMDAGPARIAAAMAIFGRNIQAIGPLLSLTSEQIEEAKSKIDEYGAVNEAAAAKGIALAESLNESKVAGMGLGNVMTDSLAPVFKSVVDGVDEMIKAFVASYNAGGDAKGVMDALAFTVKGTADVIGLFGAVCIEVFETVDGAVWFFQGLLDPLIDAVVGACKAMWDAFKTFGDVARDALTLNWGAIGDDMRSGAARVASDVEAVSKKMGADSAAAFKKGADDWMAGDRAGAGYEAWSKKMWAGAGGSAALPKAGIGTTAQDADAKAKRGRGSGRASEWTEELHAQQIASGDFFKDQTADELAFWQKKLELTKAGSKEQLAVQAKIYEAQKTLAHQAYDADLGALNAKIEADKNIWSQEQADWQAKLAFIAGKYTEQSGQYQAAYKEFEAAERQHRERMAQIAREAEHERLAELQATLKAQEQIRTLNAQTAEQEIRDQAKSSASPLAEVGAAQRIAELHRQLNEQQLADVEALYAAEDALRSQATANALSDFGTESTQYEEAVDAKKKADAEFYAQHAVLENQLLNQSSQDALKVRDAWRSALDTVAGSVSSGLSGMAKGTETLTQGLVGLGDTVIDKVISSLVRWAEEQAVVAAVGRTQAAAGVATHVAAEGAKTTATTAGVAARAGAESTGFFARMLGFLGVHLGVHTATEAAKTAATVTGASARSAAEVTADTAALAVSKALALSQIATNIALAGSGGVASMAAAPFPIDLGAPAFGAAMAAEAGAYGAIGAFAQGTNLVPADMIAQIHAGERIIPAADNAALMSAVAGGPSAGSQGDVHLHYGPHIHERERIGLRQLLASDGGEMVTFLHRAVRDGKLKLQPA